MIKLLPARSLFETTIHGTNINIFENPTVFVEYMFFHYRLACQRHRLFICANLKFSFVSGFPDESRLLSSHFLGCIKNIYFFNDETVHQLSPESQNQAELGCINACDTDQSCQHGGTCVNHYTHTSCDCFGTGFEGHRCNKPGKIISFMSIS